MAQAFDALLAPKGISTGLQQTDRTDDVLGFDERGAVGALHAEI
jgi:hypothetical protein